jgi:regulatory protein
LREHSRAELRRKLTAKGHAGDVVELVLDDLTAQGLQSDERFTERYVAQRVERGYGPLRVRAELRERGIDEALIEACLDGDERAWREAMCQVLDQRFASAAGADRRELARRARFLERRGFPGDLIRRQLFD